MILIPKILELVIYNVYKSIVCCIEKYRKINKNFFIIFFAHFSIFFFSKNLQKTNMGSELTN